VTAGRAAIGIRGLIRLPDLRRLWGAQAISDVGDALTNLALLLLVNALTGSTAALALMAIVLALPQVVFGVAAGALVDRWDRRRVMLVSDALRGAIVVGFVLVRSVDDLWLLYALGLAQATVGTFFTPARTALMPRVVPEEGLLAANSLAQMTRLVAGVLGAAAAGLLATAAGAVWPAFLIDAATFGISFLLVLGISPAAGRVVEVGASERGIGGVLRASLEGIRIVVASRLLSATLLATAVVMLGLGAVNVLFVPLLVNVLDVAPAWFGAVELAQAMSMIFSSLLVAVLFARVRPTSIVVGGMAAVGVLIALTGMVTAVWQLLVLLFLLGWVVSPVQASVMTIVQRGTQDAARGRVASLLNMLTATTSVLSMAFAGLAADRLGIRTVFLLAGMLAGAAALGAALLYRGHGLTVPSASESGPSVPDTVLVA
jgi:MFS transporter, DHA3 family, macrolide efflux protein